MLNSPSSFTGSPTTARWESFAEKKKEERKNDSTFHNEFSRPHICDPDNSSIRYKIFIYSFHLEFMLFWVF